ncbi:MAG: N-6 DNA methylase [Bacteroidetes bacterium]|nr:N-6 DNA methylase [Bacteroidota bacterium]
MDGMTGDELTEFVNDTLIPKLRDLPENDNPRTDLVRSAFKDVYNFMRKGTLLRQVVNKVNEIDFNSSDDKHHFNEIYERLLKMLQSAGNFGEMYTPRALTEFIVDMVDPKLGDTVLDPFLGSGTTTLAAKNLGRNSIGYEVNSEFIPFIKDKLSVDDTKMFDESNYTFKVQQNIYIDFEKEIEKLPYKFVDPHKFDKKIDPKKLQYGSKIDSNSGAREEYFIVKEIISPEIIKLSNNIIVRLIGVKKKKEINGKAIKFLERKTKGQKVYMKFDVDKYDSENHLLCYLYLKNKTFLNAHLIKEQLADVDDSFNYKYRNKFLNLVQYSNG